MDDERKIPEIVAEQLYTTYCEAVGGKDYRGDPLPTWEVFRSDPNKKLQSDAWIAVALVSGSCPSI